MVHPSSGDHQQDTTMRKILNAIFLDVSQQRCLLPASPYGFMHPYAPCYLKEDVRIKKISKSYGNPIVDSVICSNVICCILTHFLPDFYCPEPLSFVAVLCICN